MAKTALPFNNESEKTVIGSMIASKKIYNDALSLLEEDKSYFYDEKNAIIFEALKNLKEKVVDNAAVTAELQINMKMLDEAGGVDYLAELQDYYLGDKNAEYHLKIVHDLAIIRKLFVTTDKLKKEFSEGNIDDISTFIDKYDKEISKELQKKRNSGVKGFVTGVDTGYRVLNKLTGGWQDGTLNILAARPSVGKTAFAINLAYNAATIAKKTVAMFSLEMSAKDIVKRLIASISNVDSMNLRTGNLTDNDWMALEEAEYKLNRIKFYIDDTSGIKLGELKTKVTKLKAQDPNLGLIVIDYLGLIRADKEKADNRQNIDEISRSLKGLARDTGVPVLCLCQLSRANEKEKRKPIMSDLRDSGSIEQDADTVMFLSRENYQKSEEQKADDNSSPMSQMEFIDVDLKKNRNGNIGSMKLAFVMNISKFTEIEGN